MSEYTHRMRSLGHRGYQSGQALVETVIVMPVMLFVVLGALQLMLLAHARIMTEYAAYCAVRAGIVHNANWNVMQNAAMLASLPLYERTDSLERFVVAWAKVKAASETSQAADMTMGTLEAMVGSLIGVELPGIAQDISLVEVSVKHPNRQTFEAWRQWVRERQDEAAGKDPDGKLVYPQDGKEIDFDDVDFLAKHPEANRLGVEVRVLYPLRIPFVSRILFELFLAQELLDVREVKSDLNDWSRWRAKTYGGANNGQYLDEAVATAPGTSPVDDFFTTSQWHKELRTLRFIGEEAGYYFVPVKAAYAMPLQSNMFESSRREPTWFSLE